MKKIIVFFVFLLAFFVVGNVTAQQTEEITITELGLLGEVIRTVTVNAVYFTSGQQNLSLENGFQVYRESLLDPKTGKWSEWEVVERSPALYSDIRTYYEASYTASILHPNGTRVLNENGRQVFRLAAIPNGHSTSMWWSKDGNSINYFFSWYIIIP